MASETSFAKPRLDHPAQDWIKGMTPTLAMPLWAVQMRLRNRGVSPWSFMRQVSLPCLGKTQICANTWQAMDTLSSRALTWEQPPAT